MGFTIMLKDNIYLLLFITLFTIYSTKVHSQHITPKYVPMAQKLRSEISDRIAKKYCMSLIGMEGGMSRHVNLLGAVFEIVGPKTKEELRSLLVASVEEFLQTMNSNEEIRPYLRNFPFDASNISIKIHVVDKQNKQIVHPNLCWGTAICGHISFYSDDENSMCGDYKSSEYESYQEAYAIVKGRKPQT